MTTKIAVSEQHATTEGVQNAVSKAEFLRLCESLTEPERAAYRKALRHRDVQTGRRKAGLPVEKPRTLADVRSAAASTTPKTRPPESEAAPTIRLNLFEDVKGPAPDGWTARDQADVTWPELCDRLETLASRQSRVKTKLPAFTLGTLADAYAIGKNYIDHTALVIDVDKADEIQLDVLEASGLNLFAYASPSDPNADGTRRLRIVAELSQPIAPGDVEHARFALAEYLGIGPGQGVETAKAVAQMMFAGQLRGTPKRQTWRFEGDALNTAELLARPLALPWKRSTKPGAVTPLERVAIADPDERTAALLEAVAPYWAELEAHRDALRGLGGYLARRGWPDDQISAVAYGLAPDRPVTSRVATMLETARAARLDDNAAGWSSLTKWSPDAAAVIESVAKDPREPVGFVGVWAPCLAKMFERAAEREAPANDNSPDPQQKAGTAGTEPPPLDPSEDDWDTPEVPIDWYCKGLGIAPSERKVTLLAGQPGAGKGPLAGHLAVSFALGLPVLGAFPCKQCNVGILDYEGKRLTMRRIRAIARGLKRTPAELKGRIFVRDCDPGAPADLREWIAARKIEVLIVDSYMSAMASTDADPNSSEYAQLARELGALGLVVIVIAHARKLGAGKSGESPTLGDVAGSYALAGMAATAIAVWNPDDDDRNVARVKCLRAPDEAFATFDVRWTKDQTAPEDAPAWTGTIAGASGKHARAAAKAEALAVEHEETVARRADAIERVLSRDDSGRGIGTTALKLEAGLSGATWPEARDECLRRGSILQGTGYKTGSIAWSYIPPERRPPPERLGAKLQRERAKRDNGTEGQ